MSKLLLTLLFLIICIDAFSQAAPALSFQSTVSIDSFLNKDKKNGRRIFIESVKVANGYYDVIYYEKPAGSTDFNLTPDRIALLVERGAPLSVTNFKWRPTISIISVPFKVRPKVDSTQTQQKLPQYATASLKNLGALFGVGFNKDTYFGNGKVSNQKFMVGLLVAPSVEEFNLKNTNQKFEKETQLVISAGLTVTYTYNGVTFSVIPVGFDYGLTKEAKDWVYNKKYWWGFGIGIDVKLAGFL